jgi:hypothetical protein
MIEIIALIFLSRYIGNLAFQKGLSSGWWRFYTVIAWLLFEFIGAIIGIIIFDKTNFVSIVLVAYASAITSFYILKAYLNKLPDYFPEDDLDITHNA